MPGLLDSLARGPVVCAEGYLFECERPRFLWPDYEHVLRSFTHAGSISPDTRQVRPHKRFAHPDVGEARMS